MKCVLADVGYLGLVCPVAEKIWNLLLHWCVAFLSTPAEKTVYPLKIHHSGAPYYTLVAFNSTTLRRNTVKQRIAFIKKKKNCVIFKFQALHITPKNKKYNNKKIQECMQILTYNLNQCKWTCALCIQMPLRSFLFHSFQFLLELSSAWKHTKIWIYEAWEIRP